MRISDWSSDVCSSDLVQARVRGQRGLELLERARILQLRGDRGAGAAAAVGVGDHVRVAPDLRIHRVAGMEHAGDRPDLAAQTDLLADIEPAELSPPAGADHDFALAGGRTEDGRGG